MTLTEIFKYDTFIFDKFTINYLESKVEIKYYYEIKGLKSFIHKITIPVSNKNINKDYVHNLAFNIGVLEIVSYFKATLAKKIIINCGYLDSYQQEFFKKIFYYGLGEFQYVNKIDISYDDFIQFETHGEKIETTVFFDGIGSLIAVGGGKDSCVTLELLPKENNSTFIINPKEVMLNCVYARGYEDTDLCSVKREIDPGLLELNKVGFLNGHTPFSAMCAFVSYLTAYLNNKNSVILSNESSANEANVLGTKINHQYSKSYEFERDFQDYTQKYFGGIIKYYSLLRPLSEYQIGMLFSKYKKYHHIFKSCNVGSKSIPWKWCGKCSKCLFVYCLLSPFLYKDELRQIFGKDLFEDERLLDTFLELLGKINTKPFDCVGTFEEINYAITKTIKKLDSSKLPYLLKYYKDNYYNEDILNLNLEHFYNEENSLDKSDEELIKGVIGND